jgi:threonine dehydrogenase-like Zn-dependent dehydrogenase
MPAYATVLTAVLAGTALLAPAHSGIVSHELPLGKAPEAYGHLDVREERWTKVVLRPAA